MKFLAIVLLVLNIAYVGWMQFGADVEQVDVASSRPVQRASFVEAKEMLLLVSERPAAPAEPVAAAIAEPVAAEGNGVGAAVEQSGENTSEPSATMPWCAVVAGFSEENAALSFLSSVTELGATGELQSERVPVSSTWWVHLPPFPTQEAAAPVLAELRAKEIDNYYVRTGDLAGAISLGVFRSSQRAGIAQQELNAKGYSPSIYEMVRMGTRFNAILRLEDAQTRQQPAWRDLESNIQGATLQEIACK